MIDVLQSDDDGIIPLTKNVGEEYLYGRIENALYKLGFNEAQFSSCFFKTISGSGRILAKE